MSILIRNATVITMDQHHSVLRHANIGIDGNLISFVGEIPDSFHAEQVIDASRSIVIPGLVNAHVHTPMTMMRCIGDDLPMSEWLSRMIALESEKLTDDDVRCGCQLALLEMIRSGITCFADMYSWSTILFEEAARSGLRALIGGQYTPEGPDPFHKRIPQVRAHFSEWNHACHDRIRESIVVHALYTWNPVDIHAAIETAQELQAPIQVHVAEDLAQEKRILSQYGKSTVGVFDEWGMFEQPTLAAHCIHLSERDYEILRTRHVTPVHCPSSNLKLGNGIADIPRLLKEGIHTAIGTDGAASNNNLNILEEMHLAALLAKGAHQDPLALPADAVLRMATCDGAASLDFTDCGRIMPGYRADLTLLNADVPHMIPLRDPVAAVIYTAQASDVQTVIVDGTVLMRDRQIMTLDEERILYQAKKTAERLG